MWYRVAVGFLYAPVHNAYIASVHACLYDRSASRGAERFFYRSPGMHPREPHGTGRVGADAKKAPDTHWAMRGRQADFGIRFINYRGGSWRAMHAGICLASVRGHEADKLARMCGGGLAPFRRQFPLCTGETIQQQPSPFRQTE